MNEESRRDPMFVNLTLPSIICPLSCAKHCAEQFTVIIHLALTQPL